jgi:glycosyltransferase involved in cell wall biosynthesis
MRRIKVSFVVLTWNRYKFLEKCLEALTASIKNPEDCEIIVMDNGSTDATHDVLNRYEKNELFRIILRDKNYGLDAYKKLFTKAKGDLVVIVDDDVLDFPKDLDTLFADYMQTFPDYGFIALNVIQNEFTDGAKPEPEYYTEETRNGKTIEKGPTGGWCACFRKKEFRRIWIRFIFSKIDMRLSEDGLLVDLFKRKLKLKSGIIKDAVCFHASGPHYAKEYDHLEREIEKYTNSGLHDFVDVYEKYGK